MREECKRGRLYTVESDYNLSCYSVLVEKAGAPRSTENRSPAASVFSTNVDRLSIASENEGMASRGVAARRRRVAIELECDTDETVLESHPRIFLCFPYFASAVRVFRLLAGRRNEIPRCRCPSRRHSEKTAIR